MTEQPHAPAPARRVYFGATDKQHLAAKQISGGPDLQTLEISRRQKLAMTLTQRAEDVAAAVKTLRAFDATGNTAAAVGHLQATVADLGRAHELLVDDIAATFARYQERRENEQVLAESLADRAAMTAEFVDETRGAPAPSIPLLDLPGPARLEANRAAGFARVKPGPR